jgi:hypothetical protein
MRRLLVIAVIVAGCSSEKPAQRRSPDDVLLAATRAALDRTVVETGAFPVASADRTPPDCCMVPQPTGCTPAMFAGVPWVDASKLPPKFFVQLTYDSDGKTATVHALGNEDCDDTYTDTELSGTIDGKKAVWTVAKNATQD